MLLKGLKVEGSLPGFESGSDPVLETLSKAINKLIKGLKINIIFQVSIHYIITTYNSK